MKARTNELTHFHPGDLQFLSAVAQDAARPGPGRQHRQGLLEFHSNSSEMPCRPGVDGPKLF